MDNSATAEFNPKKAEKGFKICTNPNCNQPKKPATTEYFYKAKGYKDGLTSQCKKCLNKKNKDRIKNKKTLAEIKKIESEIKKKEADSDQFKDKPDAYMAKDLVNTFRSLFYGDDIQKNIALVIPSIRWVGVVRSEDTAQGELFYFNVGLAGMFNPVRYSFKERERAVYGRNETLIQMENYYSRGD